jgi:fibro-slime domain-containing protein
MKKKYINSILFLLLAFPIFLSAETNLGVINGSKVLNNKSLGSGWKVKRYRFKSTKNGKFTVSLKANKKTIKMKAGKTKWKQEFFRDANGNKKKRERTFNVYADQNVYLTIWKEEGASLKYDLSIKFVSNDNNNENINNDNDNKNKTITITGTLRDFNQDHVDFEPHVDWENDLYQLPYKFFDGVEGGLVTGLVLPTLDGDRKLVANNQSTYNFKPRRLYEWYHDVDGVNMSMPYTIELVELQEGSGVYQFSSDGFFPADGKLFGKENYHGEDGEEFQHNFHMTYEIHTKFTYKRGQVFNFVGDDDVWVFIDNKLVVDLGGLHSPESGSVDLDTLGLRDGETYNFDFFWAERHTTGSNFTITTSIVFDKTPNPQTPFSCEASGTVISYVKSGSASRGDSHLALISIKDEDILSDKILSSPTIGVNSIGYNVKDNYIWGYNIPSRKIVRIGLDNSINYYEMDSAPDIDGHYYNSADVSPDGVMYLKCDSYSNRLDRVQLDGTKTTQTVLSSIRLDHELNTADFAFNPKDGKIYFIDYKDGWFKSIEIDLGTKHGKVEGVKNLHEDGTYTVIAAFDVDGNFYYNSGNDIKKLSITYSDDNVMDKNSISKKSTKLNIRGMTQGDGARCANAPMEDPIENQKATLVAEYRFDECEFANDIVKDSSNSHKDAKASENVEPIERGVINNATYISKGNIEVDDLNLSVEDGKFTSVSMWIKWDGTAYVMPLSWGEHNGYNLYITEDNIGFNTWRSDMYGASNNKIKDKDWHHIVAIFSNGDVTKSKLYIDSEALDLAYKSDNQASDSKNHISKHLFIGSSSDGNYDFKALIDEVKIYNGLLTQDEIQNIYDNDKKGANINGELRESMSCGTPFDCTADSAVTDNNSYVFTSGKDDIFTKSLAIDVATKDISVAKEKFAKAHINAIGMNPVDGFMYGWAAGKVYQNSPNTGKYFFLNRNDAHLVKIDKDYNVYRVNLDGELEDSNTRFYLADIDNNGTFYMSNMFEADYHSYNLKQIRRVDLKSRRVLSTVTVKYPSSYSDPKDPRRVKCADYAIHPIDGKLYMINSNKDPEDNNKSVNQLVRVDPKTGEFEELGYVGDIGDTYSAFSFFDKYGNFYFETRATSMYKIDISEPWNGKNDTKAKAKFFQTLTGLVLSSSDGARCARSPMADKPLVEILDAEAKESEGKMSFVIKADRPLGSGKISCSLSSDEDKDIKSSYVDVEYSRVYEALNDKNITIDVELKDDIVVEDDEEFEISCSSDDLYFINKDNVANGLIKDDDANILDAFDMHDTVKKKIRTKVVNREFTLEIAALDSEGNMVEVKDMNNTKIKIVKTSECATKLIDLNATGLVDFNVSKREYSFKVDRAMKKAKVQFYWENKFGSQVSCSSDEFAIRPNKFSFGVGMSSTQTIKAGEDLNISIKALDDGEYNTKNYNENDISFKVDINQTDNKCDFDSSDLVKNNLDKFKDGELKATINYKDIGELKIDISEIKGHEFAIVDKDDTLDDERLITPANRLFTFKPDRFEIVKSFKNSSSSDKSYAFYSNSDLTNSPTWSIGLKALNTKGDVTKNYNRECVAHDVNVKFAFDIESQASLSKSLTIRKAVDNNSSFIEDSNIISANISKDIDLVAKKDQFVDGEANKSLTLNFTRSKLVELPPANVTLNNIYSVDSVDLDMNATISVDDSVTYKYMRAYIQNPIEVVGKDEIKTKIYYEAYDPNGVGNSSKSGDSAWKIVNYDDSSGKMKFFNERARYGANRVELSNEDNQTLIIKANNIPESNKVTMDLDEDFRYITDTISTNVSFSPDSANWAGEGKIGMMVDTNVSRATKFKRLDW